jgi:hypothetical protein
MPCRERSPKDPVCDPRRSDTPREVSSFAVYRRALSAVALPVLLLAASQMHLGRLLWVAAGDRVETRWLGFAAFVVLIALECHYLGVLIGLIRARGNASVFRDRQNRPGVVAKRRRRRLRLVAVGLSTLTALACAELVFRIFDIRPPADPVRPVYDRAEIINSLNALGIREDWDSIPDDDRRLRIAFLGDSFAYGMHVNAEETFCHLIEGLLADDWPTGVLTINIAEPGTDPGSQLEKYRPLRDVLKPDVVVHVIYPNDLGVRLRFLVWNLHRIRDERLWVGEGSRILAYAEKQVRYWIMWNQTLGYFRGGRTPGEQKRSWSVFKADVQACRKFAEEGGAVYSLVLFPWLYRLDDYPLGRVHERMREFASELDVPFLDLLDTFGGRDAFVLRVDSGDAHPNPKGHRIAAERITRFLREDVFPTLPR